MRRYSYRYAEDSRVIFGGHFEFEVRGDCAIVVLADHLVPLTVSEIPTQIYRRFLPNLLPARVTFIEFDTDARSYNFADMRWTVTAAAYRFIGATPLSAAMVRGLGLASPWWRRAMAPLQRAAPGAAVGAPAAG